MEIKQHNPKYISSMRKSQGRFQNKIIGKMTTYQSTYDAGKIVLRIYQSNYKCRTKC